MGSAHVLFEEVVLLAAFLVGVLRGEVDYVDLGEIEGEPEVCLVWVDFWEVVACVVGGVVVVLLVVADTRHEGTVGRKGLRQLAK